MSTWKVEARAENRTWFSRCGALSKRIAWLTSQSDVEENDWVRLGSVGHGAAALECNVLLLPFDVDDVWTVPRKSDVDESDAKSPIRSSADGQAQD